MRYGDDSNTLRLPLALAFGVWRWCWADKPSTACLLARLFVYLFGII